MVAGLERDIGSGAAGAFACGADRDGLCMRLARALVPAFADDFLITRQHRADARIGMGAVQPSFRELERAAHGGFIECAETHLRSLPAFFGERSPGNSESWPSL